MKNKIEFTKEKISVFTKVSTSYFESIDIETGLEGCDFINNMISIKLNGFVLANSVNKKILTYYCARPTFFDWLLRRKKEVKWTLDIKDILLNPPKLKHGTLRIYVPSQINN